MNRVFVYGSLMKGMCHHSVMASMEFLGPATTLPEFRMLDLGSYPGLVPGRESVHGEAYRLSEEQLARLDTFERAPFLYRRERCVLDGGDKAWIYLFNTATLTEDELASMGTVVGGDWAKWEREL